MLDSLPKVINDGKLSYYLNIHYRTNRIHLQYLPFFHEDRSVFSYWVEYENENILVYKTQEFIQKWLDEGNVIVRQ